MSSKLSEKELHFFENISFSLSEEIDIFYALTQNANIFENEKYDSDKLRASLIRIVDTLENRRSGEVYAQAL